MICPRCKQSPCFCLTRNQIRDLAILSVVIRPSDSEEFFLGKHILKDMFKMTVDEAIEQHERENKAWNGPTEEELRADGTTPLAITGPGWYRTASGQRVRIGHHYKHGMYIGYIEDERAEYYTEDGKHLHEYEPWMIVARIEQ